MTARPASRARKRLSPEVEKGLIEAGKVATTYARSDWWIIGSAAAGLHGVDVGLIGDIDLLTDREDAARILRAQHAAPVTDADVRRFRSCYGRWSAGGITVEIMGGLEVLEPSSWTRVLPKSRVPMSCGDVILYVPDRAELATIMRRFGRPKDLVRAALIEQSIRH